MSNFVILDTKDVDYHKYVLCLSCNNFGDYIKDIEEDLSKEDYSGKILFDQLLIAGNGSNRFMSCDFSAGKFDFDSAENVSPVEYIRQTTVDWLHDNNECVRYSILNSEQREKVSKNQPF